MWGGLRLNFRQALLRSSRMTQGMCNGGKHLPRPQAHAPSLDCGPQGILTYAASELRAAGRASKKFLSVQWNPLRLPDFG